MEQVPNLEPALNAAPESTPETAAEPKPAAESAAEPIIEPAGNEAAASEAASDDDDEEPVDLLSAEITQEISPENSESVPEEALSSSDEVEPQPSEQAPGLETPETDSAGKPPHSEPVPTQAEALIPTGSLSAPETPAEPTGADSAPVASTAEESPAEAGPEQPLPEAGAEAGQTEALPEVPVSPDAPALAVETAPAAEQDADPDEDAEPTLAAEPAKPTHPMVKREVTDDAPIAILVNQVYEGPLDLLLDLIRKQDIDIYDIPIAKITAQFLSYVNKLKATDVDVAGEFIYMASLLIHIKSKMLLPRTPVGPVEEAEDPRRELVERLLEHERFKNAAQMLLEKQMLEAASWTNPGMREFRQDSEAEPEIAADTTDLVRIFRDILDRVRNRPVINVEEDSVTVGQMMQFLTRRLTMEDKPIALRRLLAHSHSERALIATFLALLELVRLQAILLRQDRAFSDIFIKKHSSFEAIVDQGTTNLSDEWR